MCMLGHVQLFATPWTTTTRVPLSMEFSRQEYWTGCHFLLQRIFPIQGLNPHLQSLLHWQVGVLPLSHLGGPPTKSRNILLKIGRLFYSLQILFTLVKVTQIFYQQFVFCFFTIQYQHFQLVWSIHLLFANSPPI